MAKITPNPLIMHMTGRLDARSELVMCTNRRTGAVYTTMRKRTQTAEPTDKQREARQLFADRIHSIKQWIRANGPGRNPEHPQGTPAYLRLRNAFLEQTEIKSMMGYLFRSLQEDGTILTSAATS